MEQAQDHSQNKNEVTFEQFQDWFEGPSVLICSAGGGAKGALLGRSGAKTEKRSEVSPNAMIAALKNKLKQMEVYIRVSCSWMFFNKIFQQREND